MAVVWNSCGSFGPRAPSRVSRSRVSDRPTTSNRAIARDSPSTSPSLSSFGTWRRRFSVWRPAASPRVWSRIDAPETALDAVAQPFGRSGREECGGNGLRQDAPGLRTPPIEEADYDRPVVGAREGLCDLGSQRSPVGPIAPPETGYDGLDDGERQRLR